MPLGNLLVYDALRSRIYQKTINEVLDVLFLSRIRELEKRRDALRAEPTNKAGAEPSDGAARAEPSSLELCRVATEFEELKSLELCRTCTNSMKSRS